MKQGKLLYVSRLNVNNNNHIGVLKKVRGMCRAFSDYFDEVFVEYEKGQKFIVESVNTGIPVFTNHYDGLLGRRSFYSDILKWADENDITVFYIRFDHLDTVMVSTFKKLKKMGIKVILELPTYPYAAERDSRHRQLLSKKNYFEFALKRAAAWMEEKHIKQAHRYIDKIVTFTYDGTIWGTPTVCIENGVDCDSIKVRNHINTSNKIIIGCVANLAVWHAVDRVIEGLNAYYSANPAPEYIVEFWIVGAGQESEHMQKLVNAYGLGDYVLFKGAKRGAELEAIMDEFDIGVGTLGLHRIGLEWGSTLKAKEYCASGLPFIYASREKGLKGDEAFALKFPDDESVIDIDAVTAFALKVRNDVSIREQMRRKAENEYSWTALTKCILRDVVHE